MRYTTFIVAATLFVAACGTKTEVTSVTTTSEGEVTTGTPGKTAARDNAALIRFFNAAPEQQPLTIISQKDPLFSGVAYKGITPYIETERGVTQFAIRSHGPEKPIAARRELFPGRHYTLIALPLKKKAGTRLETFSDDLGKLDPNQARVRLINATTSGEDLDLYVQGTDTRILRGTDRGDIVAVAEMYAATVEIRPGGKSASHKSLSNLTVEPGKLYTFVAIGDGPSMEIVQIVDELER